MGSQEQSILIILEAIDKNLSVVLGKAKGIANEFDGHLRNIAQNTHQIGNTFTAIAIPVAAWGVAIRPDKRQKKHMPI